MRPASGTSGGEATSGDGAGVSLDFFLKKLNIGMDWKDKAPHKARLSKEDTIGNSIRARRSEKTPGNAETIIHILSEHRPCNSESPDCWRGGYYACRWLPML
jgi:hypothetical protein